MSKTSTTKKARKSGAASPSKRTTIGLEKFQARLASSIDAKFAEVVAGKPDGKKHFTYTDGITLTTSVRNIFRNKLDTVPPQVEAACKLSEAVLAPSRAEKQSLIKAAVGLAGGTTGIVMIIGALGTALGWGAGVVASVTAFFVGSALVVPLLWTTIGVAVTAIAGYYAFTSSAETDTERFLNVLKSTTSEAVASVWPECKQQLQARE
jgi:hypothetical protein